MCPRVQAVPRMRSVEEVVHVVDDDGLHERPWKRLEDLVDARTRLRNACAITHPSECKQAREGLIIDLSKPVKPGAVLETMTVAATA